MSDSVKVAIRIRPFIQRERSGEENVWQCQNNSICQVDDKGHTVSTYTFDRVFDGCDTTADLYEEIVSPIVLGAMGGFHGTVFAYGQTSSGKTFTMVGSKLQPGIIPCAIDDTFQRIQYTPDREFLLRASYLEIYNEKLSDLLSTEDKPLKIQLDPHNQLTVLNLTERIITSPEEALEILKEGNARKRVGETVQNDRSSRSHCIFKMIIESRERNDDRRRSIEQAVMVSHLNFVDLAGSEKAGENSGERFKEGCAINKSLLCLSNVISKLSEGSGGQDYINYRDSKLTRILQNALGGNSKTAIICTATPASVEETHSTLRFASRAKSIKNKPLVNEVLSEAALLKRYKKEIDRLKKQLAEQEVVAQQDTQATDLLQMLKDRERLHMQQQTEIERLKKLFCVSTLPNPDSCPLPSKKMRRETWCPGRRHASLAPGLPGMLTGNQSSDIPNIDSLNGSMSSSVKSHGFDFLSIPEEEKDVSLPLEPPCIVKVESSCQTEAIPETDKPKLEGKNDPEIKNLQCQLEQSLNICDKLIKERDFLEIRLQESKEEVTTMASKIRNLENQLINVTSELNKREHEFKELEEFTRLEKDLQTPRAKKRRISVEPENVLKLQDEIMNQQKNALDAEAVTMETRKELAMAQGRIKDLEQELIDLINKQKQATDEIVEDHKKEMKGTNEKIKTLEKEICVSKDKLDSLTKEKADFDYLLDHEKVKHEKIQKTLRVELQSAYEEIRQSQSSSPSVPVKKNDPLLNQLQELSEKVGTLDVSTMLTERDELKEQLAEARLAIQCAEEDCQVKTSECSRLACKLTDLKENLAELANDLLDSQDECFKLTEQLSDAKQQLEELKSQSNGQACVIKDTDTKVEPSSEFSSCKTDQDSGDLAVLTNANSELQIKCEHLEKELEELRQRSEVPLDEELTNAKQELQIKCDSLEKELEELRQRSEVPLDVEELTNAKQQLQIKCDSLEKELEELRHKNELSLDVHELSKAKQELQAKCDSLENELEELRQRNEVPLDEELTNAKQELQIKCDSLEKELEELRQRSEVPVDVEELSNAKQLQIKCDSLDKELDELRQRNEVPVGIRELTNAKQELQIKCDCLENELEELKQRSEVPVDVEELTNAKQELQIKCDSLEKELEELRQKNEVSVDVELTDAKQELQIKCDCLENELEELKQRDGVPVDEELTNAKQELQIKCEHLEKELEELRQRSEVQVDIRELTNAKQELQIKCDSLENELEELRQRSEVQVDIRELTNAKQELQIKCDSLEKELEELRQRSEVQVDVRELAHAEQLQIKCDSLEKELEELRQRNEVPVDVRELANAKQELQIKCDSLEKELEELRQRSEVPSDVEELTNAKQQLQIKCHSLENELQELKQRNEVPVDEELTNTKQELQIKCDSLEKELEELRQRSEVPVDVEELTNTKQELQIKCDSLEIELRQRNEVLGTNAKQELQIKCDSLEKELEELRQRNEVPVDVEELTNAKQQLQIKCDSLENELHELKERIENPIDSQVLSKTAECEYLEKDIGQSNPTLMMQDDVLVEPSEHNTTGLSAHLHVQHLEEQQDWNILSKNLSQAEENAQLLKEQLASKEGLLQKSRDKFKVLENELTILKDEIRDMKNTEQALHTEIKHLQDLCSEKEDIITEGLLTLEKKQHEVDEYKQELTKLKSDQELGSDNIRRDIDGEEIMDSQQGVKNIIREWEERSNPSFTDSFEGSTKDKSTNVSVTDQTEEVAELNNVIQRQEAELSELRGLLYEANCQQQELSNKLENAAAGNLLFTSITSVKTENVEFDNKETTSQSSEIEPSVCTISQSQTLDIIDTIPHQDDGRILSLQKICEEQKVEINDLSKKLEAVMSELEESTNNVSISSTGNHRHSENVPLLKNINSSSFSSDYDVEMNSHAPIQIEETSNEEKIKTLELQLENSHCKLSSKEKEFCWLQNLYEELQKKLCKAPASEHSMEQEGNNVHVGETSDLSQIPPEEQRNLSSLEELFDHQKEQLGNLSSSLALRTSQLENSNQRLVELEKQLNPETTPEVDASQEVQKFEFDNLEKSGNSSILQTNSDEVTSLRVCIENQQKEIDKLHFELERCRSCLVDNEQELNRLRSATVTVDNQEAQCNENLVEQIKAQEGEIQALESSLSNANLLLQATKSSVDKDSQTVEITSAHSLMDYQSHEVFQDQSSHDLEQTALNQHSLEQTNNESDPLEVKCNDVETIKSLKDKVTELQESLDRSNEEVEKTRFKCERLQTDIRSNLKQQYYIKESLMKNEITSLKETISSQYSEVTHLKAAIEQIIAHVSMNETEQQTSTYSSRKNVELLESQIEKQQTEIKDLKAVFHQTVEKLQDTQLALEGALSSGQTNNDTVFLDDPTETDISIYSSLHCSGTFCCGSRSPKEEKTGKVEEPNNQSLPSLDASPKGPLHISSVRKQENQDVSVKLHEELHHPNRNVIEGVDSQSIEDVEMLKSQLRSQQGEIVVLQSKLVAIQNASGESPSSVLQSPSNKCSLEAEKSKLEDIIKNLQAEITTLQYSLHENNQQLQKSKDKVKHLESIKKGSCSSEDGGMTDLNRDVNLQQQQQEIDEGQIEYERILTSRITETTESCDKILELQSRAKEHETEMEDLQSTLEDTILKLQDTQEKLGNSKEESSYLHNQIQSLQGQMTEMNCRLENTLTELKECQQALNTERHASKQALKSKSILSKKPKVSFQLELSTYIEDDTPEYSMEMEEHEDEVIIAVNEPEPSSNNQGTVSNSDMKDTIEERHVTNMDLTKELMDLKEKVEAQQKEILDLKETLKKTEKELCGSQANFKSLQSKFSAALAKDVQDKSVGQDFVQENNAEEVISSLKQELLDKEHAVDISRIELSQTVDELNSVKQEVVKLQSALDSTHVSKASLESSIEQMKSNLDKQNIAVITLEVEKAEMANKLSSKEADYEELSVGKASLQKTVNELQSKLQEKEKLFKSLEMSLKETQEELSTLKRKNSDLIEKHIEEMESAEQQLQDSQDKLQKLEKENVSKDNESQLASQKIETLEDKLSKSSTDLSEAKRKLAESEDRQNKLNQQYEDLLKEQSSLQAHGMELTKLSEKNGELEKELKDVKAELREMIEKYGKEKSRFLLDQETTTYELKDELFEKSRTLSSTERDLAESKDKVTTLIQELTDIKNEYQITQDKFNSCEKLKRELELQCKDMSIDIQRKETEIEDIKIKMRTAEENSKAQQSDLTTLHEEKSLLTKELQNTKELLGDLKSSQALGKESEKENEQKVLKYEIESSQIMQKCSDLMLEIAELKEKLDKCEVEKRNESIQMTEKCSGLMSEISELKEKLDKCEVEKCKAEAKLKLAEVRLQTSSTESSIEPLKDMLKEIQNDSQHYKELLKVNREKHLLENSLESMRKELENNKAQMSIMQDEMKRKTEERNETQKQLSVLTSILDDLNQSKSKLQRQLKALKERNEIPTDSSDVLNETTFAEQLQAPLDETNTQGTFWKIERMKLYKERRTLEEEIEKWKTTNNLRTDLQLSAEKTAEDQQKEISDLKVKITQLEGNSCMNTSTEDTNKLKQELTEKKEAIESLEKKLKCLQPQMKNQIAMAYKIVQKHESEVTRLEEENKDLKEKLESMKEKITQLEGNSCMNTSTEDTNKLKQELTEKKEAIESLEKKLKCLKPQMKNEIAMAYKIVQKHESEVTRLEEENKGLKEKLESMKAQGPTEDVSTIKQELAQKNILVVGLENELQDLRNRLEKKISSLGETVDEKNRQIKAFKQEMRRLNEQLSANDTICFIKGSEEKSAMSAATSSNNITESADPAPVGEEVLRAGRSGIIDNVSVFMLEAENGRLEKENKKLKMKVESYESRTKRKRHRSNSTLSESRDHQTSEQIDSESKDTIKTGVPLPVIHVEQVEVKKSTQSATITKAEVEKETAVREPSADDSENTDTPVPVIHVEQVSGKKSSKSATITKAEVEKEIAVREPLADVAKYAFVKFRCDGKTLHLKTAELIGKSPLSVGMRVLAPWDKKKLPATLLGLATTNSEEDEALEFASIFRRPTIPESSMNLLSSDMSSSTRVTRSRARAEKKTEAEPCKQQ